MSDRASSLGRRRKCLGSKQAEAGLPDNDTIYSAAGEKGHSMIHNSDFSGADKEELKTLMDVVRMAADVEMDILGECERPFKVYKEVTLTVPLGNGEEITGHPDRVVVGYHKEHGYFALIIDYKLGFLEVDGAAENDQLRLYALGLPSIVDVPIAKTFCRIVQRFFTHETAVYTPEDLVLALADVKAVYAASSAPDAPRTPSEEACRYCRALGTDRCPETKNMIELAARPVNALSLTPEAIANRLEMFSLAESIIEKERPIYKAMLAANSEAIPGWELKPGAIMRSVPDVTAAHAKLHPYIGDKFQECLKASVPELQSALAEAKGISEPKAKTLLKEILGDELVEKPKEGSLKQIKKTLKSS